MTVYGREAEARAILALLDNARAGRSGALAVRGQAGIGKTALLRLAADAAADMTVLRATAVETEAELPFAGDGLPGVCDTLVLHNNDFPEHGMRSGQSDDPRSPPTGSITQCE